MLIAVVLALAGCGPAGASAPAPTAAPGATDVAAITRSTASERPTSAPSSAPAAQSPAATSPTVAEIARLEGLVGADPADEAAQRDLGLALLQRVRETADPSLYAPAEAALDAALTLAPDDALVLVGIGGLQLGKHEFAEALETGRRAVAASPNLATARAVVVDALVELGRYDDASTAADEMLGVASDASTLTRVSYLAELHGKLAVALEAMQLAAATPGPAPENRAFVQAQLGNLLVATGDRAGAADAYRRALALVPAHAPSLAGQARLAVAAGDLDAAIALFGRAADILPLPEYVIALAEAQTAAGRSADAARSIKLARAEIGLFQAAGVTVDLDLALFEAEHGDPQRALGFAEAAYQATPTTRAADALAWALHRLGRDAEAMKRSDEALRLGSRDPLLRYHAGAIAAALGHVADARRDLELALSTDAGFSATGAAEVRRILATLD